MSFNYSIQKRVCRLAKHMVPLGSRLFFFFYLPAVAHMPFKTYSLFYGGMFGTKQLLHYFLKLPAGDLQPTGVLN